MSVCRRSGVNLSSGDLDHCTFSTELMDWILDEEIKFCWKLLESEIVMDWSNYSTTPPLHHPLRPRNSKFYDKTKTKINSHSLDPLSFSQTLKGEIAKESWQNECMSWHTVQYLVDSLEVTAYIRLILSLLEVEVNEEPSVLKDTWSWYIGEGASQG